MDNHQASDRNNKLNGKSAPAPASSQAIAQTEAAPPPARTNAVQQLVFLAVVAGLVILLYRSFGLEGVWNIGKAAVGLGLMVFIHELGHFVVAKWCDVQVETFSVGFGPPLPGCSFQRGETVYKLAMIPLGGYVKMIGEGDGEEHDDNPRSFKNKSVGQRMMIISAGVTMNILLAFVCFIVAYMMGVRQPVAVVAGKEPGSPAWTNPEVRTGQVISKIGDIENPTFEDLKYVVILSRNGKQLSLELKDADGKKCETTLEPVRGQFDNGPKIGISMLSQLKLPAERDCKRFGVKPVTGPAAAARVVSLPKEARIVGITDPDNPDRILALDPAAMDYHFKLGRAMQDLADRSLTLLVRQNDKDGKVEVPTEGFTYEDEIVGMTNADQSGLRYEPFDVTHLRYDSARNRADFFDFSRRMQKLAGKVVVVLVNRNGSEVPLLVPPAFHYTLPVRMKMGPIAAIREDSPAAKAGLQPDDVIEKIDMTVDGKTHHWPDDITAGAKQSPMRLGFQLRQWASSGKDARVKLMVKRGGDTKELPQVGWDYGWEYELESAVALPSPVAIPELGLAYRVGPEIADVDSSAAEDGLKKGDVVFAVKTLSRAKGDQGDFEWSKPVDFGEDAKEHPEPWWPTIFAILQQEEKKELKLLVQRTPDKEYTVEGTIDPTWPLDDRGFRFELDWELHKAASPLDAIRMGMRRTTNAILNTYQSFISMLTGRLPIAKNLRGPVSIVTMAYEVAGVDLPTFLIFLGMINISLAVVNFLPIPVLDGGHMVFLIYEKIRGKPASEQVRIYLTYAGLAFLLCLMAFVFYLDFARLLGFRK